MAAITSPLQPALHNRRRRVRHKIQTPAYAMFGAESKGAMLDLHEIVDISEDGVALQCHWPLELEKRIDLCLDLADCPQPIVTTGQVVWSNESGRAGLRFSSLPADSLSRLREWLFVNVMAGVANSEVEVAPSIDAQPHVVSRPNYTDTLAAITAVQRQIEALGSDLASALQLTAERAQVLVRASGAAIALADPDPDFMICRASSGPDAPPVGARLQVGSGFSGECAKRGVLLRCDDSELDERVDPESCRVLGIRSILAAPVRVGDKSVGLVEVFSAQPNAFVEADGKVLQRLAETVLDAANRAARAENLPSLQEAAAPPPFVAPQGSVLFASADREESQKPKQEEKSASGLTLPRSYLFILLMAAAAIFLALGYFTAPWVQSEAAPWVKDKLHARAHAQIPTVLASSQPPKTIITDPAIETATFEQLRQIADKGDPAAENALGLRYATGEGVPINEQEAIRWFTRAAEKGNVPAQSKLGSIYFSGRGIPQDPNRAYFWMMVARLGGDDASATLAPFVRARLTRSQVASIEQDASRWLQEHNATTKPTPNQAKSSL